MPTNKIKIIHTKTKNQSQQTQHIFLGICTMYILYSMFAVLECVYMNQHCHTRQRQLNLCKSVGRICPAHGSIMYSKATLQLYVQYTRSQDFFLRQNMKTYFFENVKKSKKFTGVYTAQDLKY